MDAVKLSDHGIRLWHGRLENHDFLWFATTDVNATATTWPILHNYALTYAICQFTYAAFLGYAPRYDADLGRRVRQNDWSEEQVDGVERMPAHAVPAVHPRAGRTILTQNAIDDLTVGTAATVGSSGKAVAARGNIPKLGRRVCIAPSVRGSGFDLFVFTWEGFRPPGSFRLGKKGCPMRARLDAVDEEKAIAHQVESPFRPCHPVNPRDLLDQRSAISYWPVIMPPNFLYGDVTLRGEWAVVLDGGRFVHMPRRVVARWDGSVRTS